MLQHCWFFTECFTLSNNHSYQTENQAKACAASACWLPVHTSCIWEPERAVYLIPAHPVAGAQLHKASIGLPHAVDAVHSFKASDLKEMNQGSQAGHGLDSDKL